MENFVIRDSSQEVPRVFVAPSIDEAQILSGLSYTYHSAIPEAVTSDPNTECVLGIDEAGRGPVLGPMVYGLFYLPLSQHRSLLKDKHGFDDSKVVKPEARSQLLQKLCKSSSDLYKACGWATRVMSARDIAAGMMRPTTRYNLNAQAMDATIDLIKEVLFEKRVNVKEIYIDTIGKPEVYQTKLERIFPTTMITVAKKADSLYPCVSAASVCAKVTRDAALEVAYKAYDTEGSSEEGWGSGYPSDARCVTWLKGNMDPLFGWGNECRFSWDTVKTMLDNRDAALKVDWPDPDNEDAGRMAEYLVTASEGKKEASNELANWFGTPVTEVML
ncbi:hypothetical protein MMC10_000941 [Thelotrema lepadinum]|nr:hypothetical protein [Thelotrema lepadinum]